VKVELFEDGRFFVESESGRKPYFVDTHENPVIKDGRVFYCGQCACTHFQIRLWPKIRDEGRPLRCKHIVAAREFELDLEIAKKTRNHE
jgi:hypothetical protein